MNQVHTLQPDNSPAEAPTKTEADSLVLMLTVYGIVIGVLIGWNIVRFLREFKRYNNLNEKQKEDMRKNIARLNNAAVVKANLQGECPPHIWLDKGNEVLGDHYLSCGRCGKKPNEM